MSNDTEIERLKKELHRLELLLKIADLLITDEESKKNWEIAKSLPDCQDEEK